MLIPLSHDSLEGRRWPYVTIAIIAMNVLVFLFTNGRLEHDGAASTQTRQHILVLAARFPDVEMTAEGRNYVEAFRHEHASAWKMLTAGNRRPLDAWEVRLLVHDPTPEQLNTEMAQLCEQMKTSQSDSILWNYGYHSYQPTPQSYITSMFLHGGWMHLISICGSCGWRERFWKIAGDAWCIRSSILLLVWRRPSRMRSRIRTARHRRSARRALSRD
jgi:hypothetical protein